MFLLCICAGVSKKFRPGFRRKFGVNYSVCQPIGRQGVPLCPVHRFRVLVAPSVTLLHRDNKVSITRCGTVTANTYPLSLTTGLRQCRPRIRGSPLSPIPAYYHLGTRAFLLHTSMSTSLFTKFHYVRLKYRLEKHDNTARCYPLKQATDNARSLEE